MMTTSNDADLRFRAVEAIADVLGDKPFLLGDVPTTIDAVAYGLLPSIMQVRLACPVKGAALAREPGRVRRSQAGALLRLGR